MTLRLDSGGAAGDFTDGQVSGDVVVVVKGKGTPLFSYFFAHNSHANTSDGHEQ